MDCRYFPCTGLKILERDVNIKMKKKNLKLLCMVMVVGTILGGCGGKESQTAATSAQETISETVETAQAAALEDGVYSADFDTDSGMFHVSEACDGKGTLTVKDGKMTIHISLTSKNIVNLFPGLAEDAQKDGAEILQPTVDTVTYSDGITEEVHGFDVPVPALDEEFDLALIGTKGKWYDHKVRVSNPEKSEEAESAEGASVEAVPVDMEDGEYAIDVTLKGGSGKATVASPAVLVVAEGKAYARIEWSSPNYDYMKIGDETYYPVNTEGNSVFEIPVLEFNKEMAVIADTTAMGNPHEISYTLTFDLDSAEKESQNG